MRSFAGSLLPVAIGLAFLAAGPAVAQSCFGMQAELMQLRSRGAGSGDGGRYERAYQEQANVLARTEMRARSAGCFGTGFFLFRRSPERACGSLIPKLREMQDNLIRLDSLRRRGGRDESYRMRELEGMMSARGCDVPGGSVFEARPNDDWYYEQNPFYWSGGTYRTLCVRTCDGYYFPISFSTTDDRLPEDAQTCQATCPEAEARLFYHPNPGGGPENMVSITGEPYSSLPTAFQYRTSLNPSCTCRPAGGYASAAPMSTAPGEVAALDMTAPLPRPRPAPGEDPETLANRLGYLVPHTAPPPSDAVAAAGTDASGHQIRVVGPAIGNAEQDALVVTPVPN